MTSAVVRSANRSQKVLPPSVLNSFVWLWYPARHAERLQPRGQLVEGLSQRLAPLGIGERGVARHDEEAAADGLVEVDGLLQFVALQHVHANVGAGGLQPQGVEALLQIGRPVGVAVIAGELHPREAHGRHLLQRGVEVLRAVAADGVELEGRQRRAGRARQRPSECPRQGRGPGHFEKRPASQAGSCHQPCAV